MDFERVPIVIIFLLISAAVGVAMFLALDELDEQLIDSTVNCNAVNRTGCPEGYNATQNVVLSAGNIFDLAPTWGTLIGVGVLLGIVAGFLLVGYLGYRYGRDRGMI